LNTDEKTQMDIRIKRKEERFKCAEAFAAGKRRAEILASRTEDSKARQLATEMIEATEKRSKNTDEKKQNERLMGGCR
jgi:hypothetical protein